ncbi:MAG: L-histidine N(alpha)-methyltransferase [Ferruginibacter sp.]
MTQLPTASRIEFRLSPADLITAMREDVRHGLTTTPKQLPPKYFYDAHGSRLFEEITRLPEYYPTRTERAILEESIDEIAALSGADTLVELGSGSSEKTRLILDALARAGHLRRYVPVDVSATALAGAMDALTTGYPNLELHGVVADFERHLEDLPTGRRRMIAFLGSTIGNLEPAARHRFLTEVRRSLGRGDTFLLGTDLVKDPGRLVAAYDDSAGVTAQFNLNVLNVLNRELGAGFDTDGFRHVARWNPDEERIEMWLRARSDQRVAVTGLDLVVTFATGEEMLTETSAKFRPDGIRAELSAAGYSVLGSWTDPEGDFALTLACA